LIFFNGVESFIFSGPGAGLHSVYCEEFGAVASASSLLCEAYPELIRSQHTVPDVRKVREEIGKYYVYGFTENIKIKLCLANHYISTSDMSQRRFWPSIAECEKYRRSNSNKQQKKYWNNLNYMLHRNLIFCKQINNNIILPITAGRDSRAIMSIMHESSKESVIAFTIGEKSNINVRYGKILSKVSGFYWQNFEPKSKGVVIPGFGAEIFKGYWSRELKNEGRIRVNNVLSANPLLSLVTDNRIKSRAEAYVANLGDITKSERIAAEIIYIEMFWGATMGEVHSQLDRKFGFSISLFSSFDIIDHALCLYDGDRRTARFSRELIKINASYLNVLPAGIPHYGGRDIHRVVFYQIFGWLLPIEFRRQIYSRENYLAILYTLQKFWQRGVRTILGRRE